MRERAVRMVFEAEQHTGSRWEAITRQLNLHQTPRCSGCLLDFNDRHVWLDCHQIGCPPLKE